MLGLPLSRERLSFQRTTWGRCSLCCGLWGGQGLLDAGGTRAAEAGRARVWRGAGFLGPFLQHFRFFRYLTRLALLGPKAGLGWAVSRVTGGAFQDLGQRPDQASPGGHEARRGTEFTRP